MQCLSESKLDDLLDGRVSGDEAVELKAHAQTCAACGRRLAAEQRLRQQLRALPVPEPDMAIFERAIARAAAAQAARRRWVGGGWALAASIALVIAVAGYLPRFNPVEPEGIPGLTIALHQVQEISLAVESPRRLQDARFSVIVPAGVEVAGHPGQREITWTGSLEAGQNLLVLPLRAEAGTGGDIVTSITHVDRTKIYVLNLKVAPGGDVHEPSAIQAPVNVTM